MGFVKAMHSKKFGGNIHLEQGNNQLKINYNCFIFSNPCSNP